MLRPYLLATLAIAGCQRTALQRVTLAVTTSFQDTGLADALEPIVERISGRNIRVVAVGSGEALAMGRRGDADIVVAHSPKAEDAFMREGRGTRRRPLMVNDFVVVGPRDDPATVAGAHNPVDAFLRIASASRPFVSRADGSGTHVREIDLWRRARLSPSGSWYISSGIGQAESLRLAADRQAYTLTDRATFVSQDLGSELQIAFEGGPDLVNEYNVIEVRQHAGREGLAAAAAAVADALVSAEVRDAIAAFGVDLFGAPLFKPAAG